MSDDADREYQRQVAASIAARSRESAYVPDAPIELFITRRRQPGSMAELDEIERLQLERIAAPHDPEKILAGEPLVEEDDSSLDIEVALVVDHDGTPRYRLWGGNYGWGFLMAADSLECVAYTAQHAMEHWSPTQRPIFWAMDRAWRRGDHDFHQTFEFCWWNDQCWNAIANEEPGTVGSEPSIRAQFADPK